MNSTNDNTSLFDLIFNIALGLCLMFMVSVIVMRIENQKSNIKTKAEFTIILTWQDGINHDVDLWVRDPQKNVISFKSKENGITHLDRDDLGMTKDYFIKDGRTIYVMTNQEIATIRGFMAGEWVISSHFYRVSESEEHVARCRVQITKLNPTATIILDKPFVLDRRWQEKTLARLMMSQSGNIMEVDENISIPLVETYVENAVSLGDEY